MRRTRQPGYRPTGRPRLEAARPRDVLPACGDARREKGRLLRCWHLASGARRRCSPSARSLLLRPRTTPWSSPPRAPNSASAMPFRTPPSSPPGHPRFAGGRPADAAAAARRESRWRKAAASAAMPASSPRGGRSAQTLVLIDGVRIEDAGFGTTAIQHLMLDDIERIEIARGNVSSLYGSGAIGGVVQVFTRRGAGAARAVRRSDGRKPRHHQDVQRLRGRSRAARRASTSPRCASIPRVSRRSIRGLAPLANPDDDGYRNQGLSFSASHKLNSVHEIGVALFNTEAWIDYDQPSFALPTDQQRSNQKCRCCRAGGKRASSSSGSRASPPQRIRTIPHRHPQRRHFQ